MTTRTPPTPRLDLQTDARSAQRLYELDSLLLDTSIRHSERGINPSEVSLQQEVVFAERPLQSRETRLRMNAVLQMLGGSAIVAASLVPALAREWIPAARNVPKLDDKIHVENDPITKYNEEVERHHQATLRLVEEGASALVGFLLAGYSLLEAASGFGGRLEDLAHLKDNAKNMRRRFTTADVETAKRYFWDVPLQELTRDSESAQLIRRLSTDAVGSEVESVLGKIPSDKDTFYFWQVGASAYAARNFHLKSREGENLSEQDQKVADMWLARVVLAQFSLGIPLGTGLENDLDFQQLTNVLKTYKIESWFHLAYDGEINPAHIAHRRWFHIPSHDEHLIRSNVADRLGKGLKFEELEQPGVRDFETSVRRDVHRAYSTEDALTYFQRQIVSPRDADDLDILEVYEPSLMEGKVNIAGRELVASWIEVPVLQHRHVFNGKFYSDYDENSTRNFNFMFIDGRREISTRQELLDTPLTHELRAPSLT